MIYKTVLALALCGVMATAHVCMWSPVQRNGYSIATPGESLCYLKEGPCGGVASAAPQTTLIGGQSFSVLFQQNLNHYYLENPGKLVVDFATSADPTEEDFSPLGQPVADYNAMNEITQTNFTINVQVPDMDCEHCVLRLRYLSQNPTENDRGTTFYQCADVKVSRSASVSAPAVAAPAPVAAKEDKVKATGKDCCAPQQFTLDGYETGSWRNPTAKKYYFDSVNRLFRVDTNSGSGTTTKDGSFQMISNFTSGIEYYYNVVTGTCDLYGLNYWSDWCYGSANQQTFLQQVLVGSQPADVWQQVGTPFTWTNTQHSCLPVSTTRVDSGEATFYYNMQVGAPAAGVFALPAACKRAEAAADLTALPSVPKEHKHF